MAGKLQDKVAIVTGAASGFGRGIAERFALEGARVVARHQRRGRARARRWFRNQRRGGRLRRFQKGRRRCHGARGDGGLRRVDIIVNNAGITHRNQPLLEVGEAEFDRIYAVNVKSIYLTTLAAVPKMERRCAGIIINIASTAGIRPRPGLTWYNGTKGAVITLTKSMAVELAPKNIRVNAINPVIGETGMLAQFMGVPDTPENRAKFIAGIPLGRMSQPHDIANAALFLADPASSFITGVALEVDGGRCI